MYELTIKNMFTYSIRIRTVHGTDIPNNNANNHNQWSRLFILRLPVKYLRPLPAVLR